MEELREKEVRTRVLTKQEVAAMLASLIERATGEHIVNPRIEIGSVDIVLVSDVVE